jgi:Domain of unknown function (DUF4336)
MFGTRMTVIRIGNGDLVVISPIEVDDLTIEKLNEIGEVKHIIAPNLYHYLFTSNFKLLYPQATFWAAPGLNIKKPELFIDRVLDGKNIFLDEVEYIFFDGFKTFGWNGADPLNECVFFHSASQTLILTDTAFNFDESFPLITQLAARVIGGYNNLSPSLLERFATRETEKVKQAVEKILAWDFKRAIVAHGSIVENDAKKKFKEGYERFLGVSLKVAV